jgi:primase-polymerase (primpol)-like protein
MPLPARGRIPTYCSGRCRAAASRQRRTEAIPAELRTGTRWTRRDGKRPVTTSGAPASTTDPGTWSSYAEVVRSTAGTGLGIMLGDGLGCYDLDHVTDEQAAVFAATIVEPVVYAERSMSGDGVHLFVRTDEGPGWKRTIDGISVERYTRARFIAVTGKRWEKS